LNLDCADLSALFRGALVAPLFGDKFPKKKAVTGRLTPDTRPAIAWQF
jgi:hypothetical protein